MISEEQLDSLLASVRRNCAADVQEIVGEIHEHYNEVPLFILLYIDFDLNRLRHCLMKSFAEQNFGSDFPPFTLLGMTQDDVWKTHYFSVEGPDLLRKIEFLRPLSEKPRYRRRSTSVFESGASRHAPKPYDDKHR